MFCVLIFLFLAAACVPAWAEAPPPGRAPLHGLVRDAFAADRAGDTNTALELMRRAIRHGSPEFKGWLRGVQYETGCEYYRGDGVEADPARAFLWIREAANNGNENAALDASAYLRTGVGVERSEEEANRLLDRHMDGWTEDDLRSILPEGWTVEAMVAPGLISEHCAPADHRGREILLERAARRGSVHAQILLGLMRERGDGLPRDPAKAAKWLGMAARQGDALAQLVYARLLVHGDGAPRDVVMGYFWTTVAAEQDAVSGSPPPDWPKPTRTQREEIDKLVARWRDKGEYPGEN